MDKNNISTGPIFTTHAKNYNMCNLWWTYQNFDCAIIVITVKVLESWTNCRKYYNPSLLNLKYSKNK